MSNGNIMVCVTKQRTCERLIQYGRLLRDKLNGELHIIHVAGEGINFLGYTKEPEALEYLFDISKKAGADLTVLRSKNIEDTIFGFIEENCINHIVLGEPTNDSNDSGIISVLKDKFPVCDFHLISSEDRNW